MLPNYSVVLLTETVQSTFFKQERPVNFAVDTK